jgi:membrane-associated HD superfamily phosphohydrolase
MLADSCEARIRSAQPSSTEEIDQLIEGTIKNKLESRELDESDLTLRDIERVHAAFKDVMQGVFHPRVKYPEPVRVRGADGRELVR